MQTVASFLCSDYHKYFKDDINFLISDRVNDGVIFSDVLRQKKRK